MNRLLILLSFVTFFAKNVFSDCMPMRFSAWPEKDTIVRNPLFIFSFPESGYPRFMRISKSSSVAKGIKFFLNSDHSKIPLQLIQQNLGQSNEKQLILKPVHMLKANTKYVLSFSCTDSLLREEFLDNIGIEYESRTWVTNEMIDKQAPVWLSKPKFLYKNYVRYGCGPESYWRFCLNFKDESEMHVQTIVRHLESGKISEFYLYPDSNSVIVGYHMCGGAFDMIPGERYSVSFNLVDASGNSNNQFSDPIVVHAPNESDYLSDEELERKKCGCDSDRTVTGKAPSINLGWVLGIVGIIVLIALTNWFRAYRKTK